MKRKNGKKGFTLIELLAVIAILAILVVLAVPSVLKLFNQGKQSAFRTQVNAVYSAAQTQYVADQLNNKTNKYYCYDNDVTEGHEDHSTYAKIELDASASLKYNVKFNDDGQIISITVNDGTNSMNVEKSGNAISKTDISEGSIEEATVNAVLCDANPEA